METEIQHDSSAEHETEGQAGQVTSPELKEEEAAQKEQVISIGKETDVFIQHIDSLATSFPLTTMILRAVYHSSHSDYRKFIENNCEVKVEGDEELVTIQPQDWMQYNKLIRQVESGEIALKIVSRSLLVSLVSQFDSFLGRLLRVLYSLKPEMLNASERALTFAQLSEFKSIEVAKEYVLEKEIETVLRKSHAEQFDWLEKKFKA